MSATMFNDLDSPRAKLPVYTPFSDPAEIAAAADRSEAVFKNAVLKRRAVAGAMTVVTVAVGGATILGIEALFPTDPDAIYGGMISCAVTATAAIMGAREIDNRLKDSAVKAWILLKEYRLLRNGDLGLGNHKLASPESLLVKPEKTYRYTNEPEGGERYKDDLHNTSATRPILRRAFNNIHAERWLKFFRNVGIISATAGALEAVLPGGSDGLMAITAGLSGAAASQALILNGHKKLEKIALDYLAADHTAQYFHRTGIVGNFWYGWNGLGVRKLGNLFDRLCRTPVREINFSKEEIATARGVSAPAPAIVPPTAAAPVGELLLTDALPAVVETPVENVVPFKAAAPVAEAVLTRVKRPVPRHQRRNRFVAGSLIVGCLVGVAVFSQRPAANDAVPQGLAR